MDRNWFHLSIFALLFKYWIWKNSCVCVVLKKKKKIGKYFLTKNTFYLWYTVKQMFVWFKYIICWS